MADVPDLPGFDPADWSTWHPMHGPVVCALQGAAPMLGVRPGVDMAPAAEHIARRLYPAAETQGEGSTRG